MSKLGYLGSLTVGGCIGAVVAWIFTKKKYEKLVADELKSIKEEFSKNTHIVIVKDKDEAEKLKDKLKNEEDLKQAKKIISDNNYTSYKQALNEVKKTAEEQEDTVLPYCIEPDEQGETGFARETLIWYEGDGTLADETGHVIDLPDEVIGLDILDEFGDQAVIYVRNETDGVDYEVIKDTGTFAEANSNPNYIIPESDE